MHIDIKTRRHELTGETRGLVEEKFSSLDKLMTHATTPPALACEIEESLAIERAGGKYRVEGNLSIDGKLLRAEAINTVLEGAIDSVRDDLMRQLQHLYGKKRGFIKRGGAALKRLLRFGSGE